MANILPITATFIDEISHDIPHQNWSEKEWRQDLQHMKAIEITTVIMIRSGYRKFITYPSKYLIANGCYKPPIDLVEMFLRLTEELEMEFYFGLYDSGEYWDTGNLQPEITHNQYVIDEIWNNYGKYKSFKGWYLSMEISRKTIGATEAFQKLGLQCKQVSDGLTTFISPWIDGKKAVLAANTDLTKQDAISIQQHEKEWREIFSALNGAVDAVAFQDGHIEYDELDAFFTVNKKLADEFGLQCWTNAETFDRDMPIKFLPIKFEKLKLKLEAAKRCNFDKAITFEFSHFLSPQSMYPSAQHLYNRYKENL